MRLSKKLIVRGWRIQASAMWKSGRIRSGFNWKRKGFSPIVRNQGNTDYCPLICTTSVVEGCQYATDNRNNTPLSEQQLIDRFPVPLHGIVIQNLLRFYRDYCVSTRKNYPTRKENGLYRQYPLDAGNFPVIKPWFKVTRWKRVRTRVLRDRQGEFQEHHEIAIRRRLRKSPVLAFMQASRKFKMYEKGIFSHRPIGHRRLLCDHAVMIVGYDRCKTTGEPYFIVLNSWGPKWGLGGYAYVKRFVGLIGEDSYYPVGYVEREETS